VFLIFVVEIISYQGIVISAVKVYNGSLLILCIRLFYHVLADMLKIIIWKQGLCGNGFESVKTRNLGDTFSKQSKSQCLILRFST